MSFFRNKKFFLNFNLMLILLIIAVILTFKPELINNNSNLENYPIETSNSNAKQANTPIVTKILLITRYVVGEDTVEKRNETINSIKDLEKKYPDWEIIDIKDEQIILEKNVEDISPECKDGAYFGLNPDGYLTLYKGSPEDIKVIETFFRIDVQSLESGLPKEPVVQLYQGIPINDLAEFNSVLSTFSEFSID